MGEKTTETNKLCKLNIKIHFTTTVKKEGLVTHANCTPSDRISIFVCSHNLSANKLLRLSTFSNIDNWNYDICSN